MNFFNEDIAAWQVKFFYGNSKNIMEFSLNNYLLDTLKQNESVKNIYELVLSRITNMDKIINSTNALSLQNVWSRRQESGLHPYEIIDVIGDVTGSIINLLIESEVDCITIINQILSDNLVTLGSVKILKHSTATLAGLIVCSIANTLFNKKPFKK